MRETIFPIQNADLNYLELFLYDQTRSILLPL